MASETTKGLTVKVTGDTTGLKTELKKAEDLVRRYQKQLTTINKALSVDPTNADNISKKQQVLKKLIQETTTEIQKYQEIQQKMDSDGVSHESYQWIDVENRIIAAQTALTQYKDEVSSLSDNTLVFKANLDKISESAGALADKLAPLSTLAATGLSTIVKQSMSYESSIANIKKVVTDLTDETVQDLKDIAVQSGITFDELSDYASIAGSLGIAEGNISEFVKAMADLNTATGDEISGEEGAKAVARFLELMNIGTDQVDNFGSALTYVADQFAATAGEVLDSSSAMAGLASIYDVSENDLIGLASVMQSLGITSEVSASSMTKVFAQIQKTVDGTVENADDKLALFAQTSGKTVDEFVEQWETRPMEAVLDFTDGLQGAVFNEISDAIAKDTDEVTQFADALGMTKTQFIEAFNEDSKQVISDYATALGDLDEDGDSAITTLSNVGLSNIRVTNTLLKLSGSGQEVKQAIQDSNDAWNENTALTDKAGTVYETTENQIKGAIESLKQSAADLGENLLPIINDITDGVKDFSEWFSSLSDSTKKSHRWCYSVYCCTVTRFKRCSKHNIHCIFNH